MAESIDVDNVLRALGKYKRYTIIQIIYNYFICVYLIAFPMLVYVLVGYSPPHRCKPLNDDLYKYGLTDSINVTYTVIAEENCHTVLSLNISNTTQTMNVPCIEGYVYDINQETFVTEWNLVCDKAGLGELTQTIFTAGQAVGALLFPSLSDRFGRKPVSITAMLSVTILSFVASFSNYFVYTVLKFFTGAIQQGVGLTMAVYLLEQVPRENRGFVSALGSFGWGTSMIGISAVGYFMQNMSWRYVQMVSGLNGLHAIATFWILDESLRWLIANKKMTKARLQVKKIARINKVNVDDVLPLLEDEIEITSPLKEPDLLVNVDKQDRNPNRENLFTILQHKLLLKTTGIMAFTWFTNSLVYFGLTFTSTQLAGDRHFNFFLNVAVETPAMITFMILVRRYKRKRISVIFHSIAGISLVLSVIFSTLKERNHHYETASIIFSFIGKFGITGSFSLIFLFTPELYPTNLRNIGIGLGSMSGRVGGMLAPYATMLATYIEWAPGIIFGVCCGVATLLQLLLPETSGKELPQSVRELREWDKQRSLKFKSNETKET
ncbi:MFS transporter, OCT family, solute carrier family 22 (organic cation transporter), member 4/5 [Mytilus galloprovincialis]|uniref:MFS transporter, OCT family, solute carrier family 22 (Organic cation transporter), member 4/5 n=1 Tax=Mytilus galloprovincialis TaxID=29158 RepID=A0A8B6GTT0_MYTGA|nr:MFS transporter, OCT family, solute carrier family 22 (organic cation transporter), member 4/5 [Mytilus galloprovincialis]